MKRPLRVLNTVRLELDIHPSMDAVLTGVLYEQEHHAVTRDELVRDLLYQGLAAHLGKAEAIDYFKRARLTVRVELGR